jgi:NADH-quinone oxidoreductase subunit N
MRTFGNLLAFSPELWLLIGAIVVFVAAQLGMNGRRTTTIALAALVLGFAALATQFKQTITILDGAFLLDGFAIVIDVVILATVVLALLASAGDLLPGDLDRPALPGFYLLATLGAMLAVSAAEMIALFVSLELLAVNLYLLLNLTRRGPGSTGPTVGYAIAGAVSSGLFLYGLALLFGLTGDTHLRLGAGVPAGRSSALAVILLLSLLIAGLALRMGVLPVRWWGRSFEVGASLRIVVLVQGLGALTAFAVFGRILATVFARTTVPYAPIIAVLAAVVMTAGTVLSVTQGSLRRMVAYAAIGQAGFALAAFTDLRRAGLAALVVFLVALALTTTGAYASVIAYARSVHTDSVRDLAGMSAATPGLALSLSLALLSLAGVPPLVGFLGRLLVLQAMVEGGYAWLAVIGIANIVFGGIGYLRIVKLAFVDPPIFEVERIPLDGGLRVAVGAATAGIVFTGFLLGPLYSAASYARNSLLH